LSASHPFGLAPKILQRQDSVLGLIDRKKEDDQKDNDQKEDDEIERDDEEVEFPAAHLEWWFIYGVLKILNFIYNILGCFRQ